MAIFSDLMRKRKGKKINQIKKFQIKMNLNLIGGLFRETAPTHFLPGKIFYRKKLNFFYQAVQATWPSEMRHP